MTKYGRASVGDAILEDECVSSYDRAVGGRKQMIAVQVMAVSC